MASALQVTRPQVKAMMRYERSSRDEQGGEPNYHWDRHKHIVKSLKSVRKNKKYLSNVGIFILCRNNRICRKLELGEVKLDSPGHRLFLLGKDGS